MTRAAGLEHVFNEPWEATTTAFWCKYPSPDLAHVRDALVLSRHVDEKGVLHTTRLMCIEQSLPALLKRFANGLDSYYALERSTVDPARRRMVLETRNLTFDSVLVADEVCTYEATEDGRSTRYTWNVSCSCTRKVPLITGRVEEALVDKALGNSSAGLAKMEQLATEVSRKRVRNEKPAFSRWPTRFPSRSYTTDGTSRLLTRKASSTLSPPAEPRRFGMFGPRKPLAESSLNPFKPDDAGTESVQPDGVSRTGSSGAST